MFGYIHFRWLLKRSLKLIKQNKRLFDVVSKRETKVFVLATVIYIDNNDGWNSFTKNLILKYNFYFFAGQLSLLLTELERSF